MTRKLRYSMSISLDGFIAGPTGDFSWARPTRSCTSFTTTASGSPAGTCSDAGSTRRWW